MKTTLNILSAVEDQLSMEVVSKTMAAIVAPRLAPYFTMKDGQGYLRSRIREFNKAAGKQLVLVMTDLDDIACAPMLLKDWLQETPQPGLLFQVAVRETEAWLIADRASFAKFLDLPQHRIPATPDELQDPKKTLVDLARQSANPDLIRDIVPTPRSLAKRGKGYNSRLREYVRDHWNPVHAAACSPSLARFIRRLKEIKPIL